MSASADDSQVELLPLSIGHDTNNVEDLGQYTPLENQESREQHRTPRAQSPSSRTLSEDEGRSKSNIDRLHTVQPQIRTSSIQEWNWELFTWVFATASLATILALLGGFNGKPLEKWRSEVSLNAMLSVLSQVAQSALLVSLGSCIGQLKWDWFKVRREIVDIERFDEASRGPQGSLTLLWSQLRRQRSFHLVSIGAIATVFIEGMSPFTQEALSTNTLLPITIDKNASIYQCFNLTRVEWIAGSPNWMGTLEGRPELLEPVVLNGISTGMVGTTTPSDLDATCGTGNCRWDPYSTLGICASSRDATHRIRNPSLTTSSCSNLSNSTIENPNHPCDITILTDNGKELSSKRTGLAPPGSSHLEIATFWIGYQHDDWGILNVYIIYEDVPWAEKSGQPRNWAAVQGTLQPCVLDLHTEVINGHVKTTVVEKHLVGRGQCAFLNGNEICATEAGIPGWKQFAGTLAAHAFSGSVLIYGDEGDNYFRGSFSSNLFVDIYGTSVFRPWSGRETHIGSVGVTCPPEDPDCIPGLDGFAARLDSFAASVTNSLRHSLGGSVLHGETQIWKPYIIVNFWWMLPPILLWAAATFFLFSTMYKTRRGNTPLWKSSPLVTLYCMDSGVETMSAKAMKKNLERAGTHIVLEKSADRWKLEPT